jgi:hypothetical protein
MLTNFFFSRYLLLLAGEPNAEGIFAHSRGAGKKFQTIKKAASGRAVRKKDEALGVYLATR